MNHEPSTMKNKNPSPNVIASPRRGRSDLKIASAFGLAMTGAFGLAMTSALCLLLAAQTAQAAQTHSQQSDRSRVWFDLPVEEKIPGRLSIPAGPCWLQGQQYALAAYQPNVGNRPFQLWVEKSPAGADYLLDLTGEAPPESFGDGVGAVLVAWRTTENGTIHILRSVPDEE